MDAKDLQRFWAKVDKNGPVPSHRPELGPCWVWTAAKSRGYGVFRLGARIQRSNRVGWMVQKGGIPDGLCALHECDNRACVRGSHLFLGTKAENNADMVAKGRDVHLRGHAHGCAKLTGADVVDIRSRHVARGSQRRLAKEFGVSFSLISQIVNRDVWAHIG